MSSIPLPAQMETNSNLRPLDALRDLPQVADLIELCFHKSMDSNDQNYVRQMRRAGRDAAWMRSLENTSGMPLNGYVWEEGGKIIGNASLILFRNDKRKVYLVANVAVHPDSRRRGIGRAVTERVVNHARERGADEIWLNARDDNPDALDLYADLGFTEHSRRTQWLSADQTIEPAPSTNIRIVPRNPRYWLAQLTWLTRLHPNELAWYRSWNFRGLAPGLWNWLHILFVNVNLRQWAALCEDQPQAFLSWVPDGSQHDPLWLAHGSLSAPEAITNLLIHARRELGPRKFSLEHPAGAVAEFIRAAGFIPQRTLIWMRADGATK